MRFRYAIGGILAAALIALPGGAAAKQRGRPVRQAGRQQCKQERQELGPKGFRKKYGAKNQMRKCIKRTRGRVQAAAGSAKTECEPELAEIGSAQFIEDYGSDDTGYDAMAECSRERIDEILNPGDYDD